MLKNKEVLVKEIKDKIKSMLGSDITSVDCNLSEFIKQDGKINRLYVNVSVVDKKRRYQKGSVGYFDLNEKEFIKEGYFWTAGVRDKLQEICMNFEIEVVEKSEKQLEEETILENIQLRKNEIKQEIDKLVKEMKDVREKDIQKLAEENGIDLHKDPFGFMRLKNRLVDSEEYLKLKKHYELLEEELKELE